MNDLNRENADKITRTLYHLTPNEIEEYMKVCEANEIPQSERDNLFRYLDARGFLEVAGKVGNGDVYIQLSKVGFKFFAEENLVSEYARLYLKTQVAASQVYNISGDASNFGNLNQGPTINTNNHNTNNEPESKKWVNKFLHDTTTQIVSALIVAIIIALVTWYFRNR